MKLVEYIKKNGLKYCFNVIYEYKINNMLRKILKFFLKNVSLKDIIVIESHNDFDCNGGAFYDYLIKNNYNRKYKIVWLLKRKESFKHELPENVVAVPLLKPSIRKNYYLNIAKYLLADNTVSPKSREEQKSFYLTHGAGGLKNVRGIIVIDNSIDYVLVQSENYAEIQAYQYSMDYPNDKLVCLGYPVHDILNSPGTDELKKITDKSYDKVVLWMPTFRKGGGFKRNDSTKEQPLGIPLFEKTEELEKLNSLLNELNLLLIIKLHPMQDISDMKLKDMSNITVLTGQDVKRLNVDNYRLMKCTDALISDYSGAAFEYLQLNRPIAYVLDDLKEYKLGFVVEDIDTLIAGQKIFTIKDFNNFIINVKNGNDNFKEKRIQVRDYIYKFHDTDSCKRLADFMGL